ncbi:UNVERIFIED_CONTAM: Serine carboxypeptidase 3 [Sesamum calycinum]|uniref:Carboxypeptidase n=1 Tax=Sesamum calycinum TaxID=2727403 RepID=A0AAW2SDT3_9LAMI
MTVFHVCFQSEFPRTQAERLIRALNLFPKNEVNHHAGKDHGFGASRIVEKRFKFPFLGIGASVQDLGHHAGYYRLQHSKDARYNAVLTMLIFLYLDPSEGFVCVYVYPRDFPSHFDATPDIFMIGMMFYFFFESRNSRTDPVVIWLTGGPGCSSELALFYENGPFHITKNLSLTWNDFGWDKVSNLIYVDQPTGTGFSYSSDDDDIRHNEKGVSNDLYDFLQAFFKEHPQYAKNDFYITGESYAGHYIPAFAARVHQGNKRKEGIHINLKYQAYTDYALDMKLITKSDYNSMKMSVSRCQQAIKLCGANGGSSCVAAYMVCNAVFNNIVRISGGKNYYDIRKECEGNLCYDFSSVEDFLNLKSVRDALGVGDIDFVSCSSSVYEAMVTDIMRNLEVGLPALLEDGIKLLVYAGEYDLICNWIGNSRWVHAMEWSGQKKFVAAPTIPFSVDGLEAGLQKGHGPLTFLKVHNAGHMVPMDQPKASLEMLRRWMQGKLTQPEDHLSPM